VKDDNMSILKSIRERETWHDWMQHRIRRMRRHGSVKAWAKNWIEMQTRKRIRVNYAADGFGVKSKNMSCLREPAFAKAWAEAVRLNKEGWKGNVPNIEWRAHIACWAAQHGLSLEGDFVECGVHTGLLSVTICNYLDFAKQDRKFWLFDTWSGIPVEGIEGEEAAKAELMNRSFYGSDAYELAVRNFEPFPNAKLVRGALPGTLELSSTEKIAYMSVDLNNVRAEKAVIEALWPKISKGAMIVLDDYGFTGHEDQHDMWDAFAQSVGKMIVTVPTGQGIVIK
jgi:hypothetical protein